MTTLKSLLLGIALVYAGLGSIEAQTADSPAALKTTEQIRATGPAPEQKEHIHRGKFWDDTSVAFGLREWENENGERSVQLSEFTLNQRPIDPDMWAAINAFLRAEVYNINLRRRPIQCESGVPIDDKLGPCEKIRLEFDAEFHDQQKFQDPITGIYHDHGLCLITVMVGTGEIEMSCFGRDEGRRPWGNFKGTKEEYDAARDLDSYVFSGSGTGPFDYEDIQRGKFWDDSSASIGFNKWHDSITGEDRFELSELTLNEVPIDSNMFERINAFVSEKVYNTRFLEQPIQCSRFGPAPELDKRGPCEEIRLQFSVHFRHGISFPAPENGLPRGAGRCSIFVEVRTRDASVWCYGQQYGLATSH